MSNPLKESKTRVWSAVNKTLDAQLDAYSEQFGLTKSQIISICLQIGMKSLIRVLEPEKSVSPEFLADVLRAMGLDEKEITGQVNSIRGVNNG